MTRGVCGFFWTKIGLLWAPNKPPLQEELGGAVCTFHVSSGGHGCFMMIRAMSLVLQNMTGCLPLISLFSPKWKHGYWICIILVSLSYSAKHLANTIARNQNLLLAGSHCLIHTFSDSLSALNQIRTLLALKTKCLNPPPTPPHTHTYTRFSRILAEESTQLSKH